MTRNNRNIWNKILKAKKLVDESKQLLSEIMSEFDEDELEINLHASSSANLLETIQCCIQYGEDEEKVYEYLSDR